MWRKSKNSKPPWPFWFPTTITPRCPACFPWESLGGCVTTFGAPPSPPASTPWIRSLNWHAHEMTWYKKVRNQNNQGRQTNVTPATGSQEVDCGFGRIMYTIRQPPPATIEINKTEQRSHMDAHPDLGLDADILCLARFKADYEKLGLKLSLVFSILLLGMVCKSNSLTQHRRILYIYVNRLLYVI